MSEKTDGVVQASRTARRVVQLAFAATLALVALLLGERAWFIRDYDAGSKRVQSAQHAADQILLQDERLTMSALMAASTSDLAWIERYDIAIPEMDSAIAQARSLADAQASQEFDRETTAANDHLVVLERRAFDHVRRGELPQAQSTLASDDYALHKKILSDGTDRFMGRLQDSVQAAVLEAKQRSWLAVAVLLAMACLAFAALWRRLNQHLARSEDSFHATQAEVTRLALYDTLTGLPNRRYLKMQLDGAIARAQRERSNGFAVLVLDLDGFKPVNDRYGHPAGDAVLVEVGRRLARHVRKDETVARLGGDEFVLVIEQLDDADTPLRTAQRLVAAIAEPITLADATVQVGTSVGIAVYPADGEDGDALIRRADMALYRAKDAGRGQCRYFQESMDKEVHDRAQLEIDLRRAITLGQIVPYFQPLVDLATQRLTGFEVLSRWIHPERGLVSPVEFIPVAEDAGLIDALTLAVMRQALRDAQAWDSSLTIAVNIAPQQLKDESLGATLEAVLRECQFPPERLEIEITENALIGDLGLARRVLRDLKSRGIRVALDDFGTGYSSLSHLSELPFDKIKIDRSFIQSMDERPQSATIVNAVIALGRSLQLATTAEGIETEAHAQALSRLGCGSGQGFLYARPMPASEVPMLMQRMAAAEADLRPALEMA
jgi:diguanylate cyclase (GGDEF)-like protein